MYAVNIKGRLGNNLFQYAFSSILNEIYNTNGIYLVEGYFKWEAYNLFNLDIRKFNNDFNIINRFVEQNQDIQYNFSDIKDYCYIEGFFQNYNYYKNHENLIKDIFKIETNLDVRDDVCYIHFRGGDFKNIPDYYLPLEYYNNAKYEMLKYKNDLKFIVITDDKEEASKYFKDDEINSNDMCSDFIRLYHSKYTIIPNSSFSYWAAWLSILNNINVKTIAPEYWFNYNKNNHIWNPLYVKNPHFNYI